MDGRVVHDNHGARRVRQRPDKSGKTLTGLRGIIIAALRSSDYMLHWIQKKRGVPFLVPLGVGLVPFFLNGV